MRSISLPSTLKYVEGMTAYYLFESVIFPPSLERMQTCVFGGCDVHNCAATAVFTSLIPPDLSAYVGNELSVADSNQIRFSFSCDSLKVYVPCGKRSVYMNSPYWRFIFPNTQEISVHLYKASVVESSVNVEDSGSYIVWKWEGNGDEYEVFKEGVKVAVVTEPVFCDSNVETGVQYCYNFLPWHEGGCKVKCP